MPRKGMNNFCFNSKTPSLSNTRRSELSPTSTTTTPCRSFSDVAMEQTVETAASLIMKWDPDSSVTSVFYDNKREAMQFLKCVADLQKAMHLLSTQHEGGLIIRAQTLMEIAMKRLQKEFYQILSTDRASVEPESICALSSRVSARSNVSDCEDDVEDIDACDSIYEVDQVSSAAMSELRSIAECMISSGYAKECAKVYKIIRKSIIDKSIHRLGIENMTSSQVNKMDWETVLDSKINNWLEAVNISMRTLFKGERILCDHVFAASDSIREFCFREIAKDGAVLLFGFPELVAKFKKSPLDKMFRILDMYAAISDNWMEIESIFSFESLSVVRSEALSSLAKLSESILTMLSSFEHSIQKDSSKTPLPAGADIHPLTTHAMNHLTLLGNYGNVLSDVISDWPPPPKTSLPISYFESPESGDSPISVRFAWLTLVLLCKLDGKSKSYKDVSLSYLFLANNLQYVINKVKTSNLLRLLGEGWLANLETKVEQFSANYVQLAWGQVFDSLPESNPAVSISPDTVRESFKRFNSSFEEAYRKQSGCIVSDPKVRHEIKASISRKIMPVYREFYDQQRNVIEGNRNVRLFVRYTPDEVGNYLLDLFFSG